MRNFCHRIGVIDHNEGDARGLGMSRPGAQARDEKTGGETAKGGHDGEISFHCGALRCVSRADFGEIE